MNKNLKDRL